MNIDNLTIGEPKAIQGMIGNAACAESAYAVGDKLLIRTVTMIQLGRVVKVTPGELVLEDASWIADTGRFSAALATGELSEIEPVEGPMIVNRGAIVDASEWRHDFPRKVK